MRYRVSDCAKLKSGKKVWFVYWSEGKLWLEEGVFDHIKRMKSFDSFVLRTENGNYIVETEFEVYTTQKEAEACKEEMIQMKISEYREYLKFHQIQVNVFEKEVQHLEEYLQMLKASAKLGRHMKKRRA